VELLNLEYASFLTVVVDLSLSWVNAYSELISLSSNFFSGREPSSISVFGSRVKAALVESSNVFYASTNACVWLVAFGVYTTTATLVWLVAFEI